MFKQIVRTHLNHTGPIDKHVIVVWIICHLSTSWHFNEGYTVTVSKRYQVCVCEQERLWCLTPRERTCLVDALGRACERRWTMGCSKVSVHVLQITLNAVAAESRAWAGQWGILSSGYDFYIVILFDLSPSLLLQDFRSPIREHNLLFRPFHGWCYLWWLISVISYLLGECYMYPKPIDSYKCMRLPLTHEITYWYKSWMKCC